MSDWFPHHEHGVRFEWGPGPLSGEAAARSCCTGTPGVAGAVTACSSGMEPTRSGFADDVSIATEPNAGTIVPALTDGAFRTEEARRVPVQLRAPGLVDAEAIDATMTGSTV